MPVATVSTYEEMWVHPQVVAALYPTRFTYGDIDAWSADVAYPVCSHVLAGDGPYGGFVWTNIADIAAGGPGPLTPNQVVWVRDDALLAERLPVYAATVQATYLLDVLTGFRLHGQEFWSEDYQVNSCTVALRRRPVESIHSVQRIRRCNQIADETIEWCHTEQSKVSVCCGQSFNQFQCGCQDNVVRIIYTIGSNLPPGTERLVAWLANEYAKAYAGESCALPDRISTITRQGVSWTMIDPQDFLPQGNTGMARVDAWLRDQRIALGGTLIDPLQSTRLFSTRLDALPAQETV